MAKYPESKHTRMLFIFLAGILFGLAFIMINKWHQLQQLIQNHPYFLIGLVLAIVGLNIAYHNYSETNVSKSKRKDAPPKKNNLFIIFIGCLSFGYGWSLMSAYPEPGYSFLVRFAMVFIIFLITVGLSIVVKQVLSTGQSS